MLQQAALSKKQTGLKSRLQQWGKARDPTKLLGAA